MPTGLRCLIEDAKVINRIKASFNNIANIMIANNPAGKVTAKEIYNQLKSAGVDIDLESVAAIYSDAFASSIGIHSNYETDAELLAYKQHTQPLNAGARNALIKAGFGKTQKNGKQILDWVKLMRKSEDEIRDEVAQAITDSFPSDTPGQTVINEVDAAMAALKGSWKQILSNAVIKGQNDLKHRNEPITVNQKNAIDKISDLYAEGLFAEFKDDYATAIRKAVGVNNTNLKAMAKLDALGKTANLLANSPYGTKNSVGEQLEQEVNDVIAQARYEDAPFAYKAIKTISSLIEFVLLKTLNNPFNRTQNYLSGVTGRFNTRTGYGANDPELKDYAFAVKRDIIRNGGRDFGDINNMFTGNRSAVDRFRKQIVSLLSDTPSRRTRVGNWVFNQVMGTASLNAVDSYNKVLNTWARFASGMEDILVSKGIKREDAQQQIHEALYGENKWAEAYVKAEKVIDNVNKNGGNITKNDSTIKRFAGDIVKAEIVERGLLTDGEMTAAFNAGYRSAGREMGHVPNNYISKRMNNFKQQITQDIDKAVKAKNYSGAASLILEEMFLSKIVGRFVSGGTNWVFLKLEKGGMGIVRAEWAAKRYKTSFLARKTLSQYTAKEIEDHLYNMQKTNDSFRRGAVGAIANTVLLVAAMYVVKGQGEDEEEKMKKRLAAYLKDHYVVQKMIDGFLPWYLSAYIAKMKQDVVGYDQLDSKYKKQPAVEYVLKFINQNQDFTFIGQAMKGMQITKDDAQKQKKGWEVAGGMLGNYFDLNPFPTKMGYDIMKIHDEITGNTKYTPPKYKTKAEAFYKGVFKFGIGEKILK